MTTPDIATLDTPDAAVKNEEGTVRSEGTFRRDDGGVSERSLLGRTRTTHVCVKCQSRRSLFRYAGAVKADADHNLCFQCYRGLRDSLRARRQTRANLCRHSGAVTTQPIS